jgi:hypothetical protein
MCCPDVFAPPASGGQNTGPPEGHGGAMDEIIPLPLLEGAPPAYGAVLLGRLHEMSLPNDRA